MIYVCQQFLQERLTALVRPDGLLPYWITQPDLADPGNIFFGELSPDYLKDHDWAAQALALQDRSTWDGKAVGKTRSVEAATWTLRRRRFKRVVLYRCFIYAPRFADLWGEEGYTGLVDQFLAAVAERKVIRDQDGNAIRVEPEDAARPAGMDTELSKRLRRSELAIVRVRFIGGIYTSRTTPLVTGGITFNPTWRQR